MDAPAARQALLAGAIEQWRLVADGDAITTPTSLLLPVLRDGRPAMLKVTDDEDERHGHLLMRWWDGDGAARVLAADDGALLMQRGGQALLAMASTDDAQATHIICDVAARLHAPRGAAPEGLVPLENWFAPLLSIGPGQGGLLARAAATAAQLLATPREVVPLHGDLHHENILDFDGVWRAIDPKRLSGERSFEYTTLFCDPDIGRPEMMIARRPENFTRRLEIVSDRAGIERRRLLDWILAWTGLSWAWAVADGVDAPIERTIAEFAAAALDS